MENLEIQQKRDEKMKDAYLSLSHWWGLRSPGSAGIIVTKDGKVYSYQEYIKVPVGFEEEKANYFKEKDNVSKEVLEKIEKYFEENIKGKEFGFNRIYDAGWKVIINGIEIENHRDIYEDLHKIINGEK